MNFSRSPIQKLNIFLGGPLVGLIIVTACSSPRVALRERLISALEQKRGNDHQVIVPLKQVTGFAWDKFYAFGPYTAAAQINRQLGFDWPGAANTGIEHQDQFDLLIFVKDDNVVEYVTYPREHGDFYKLRKSGYAPDEAIFEIRLEDHGIPMLVPVEIASRR